MNISSYSDRIGGFVSTNSGTIENCFAKTKVKSKQNAAGFVYENTGKIESSITKSSVKAGKNRGSFFCKNRGEVKNCTWIDKTNRKKEQTPDKIPQGEAAYTENEALKTEEGDIANLRDKLNLSDEWKIEHNQNSSDIYLDESGLSDITDSSTGDVIEISNAEELFEMTSSIASGDPVAAKANYRLTSNINLKGKKWLPIGLTEQNPFSGTFEGAGYKISNFTISSAKLDYAGFFGYIKDGKVSNLNLDCIVSSKNSSMTGSMAGVNDNGLIKNCHVRAKVTAEKCFGGFVGRNSGSIFKSSFYGNVFHIIPPILIWIPSASVAVAVLAIGSGVMVHNFTKSPYKPSIIDPNQRPVVDNDVHVDPPPPGSNRISFELNQEVYVDVKTHVGGIDYVNPHRSTQDVVISVRVTDAELLKVIGNTGRTKKEQEKLESDPKYDPAKSYHELYRSGRLQIGYKLEDMVLSKLPNGQHLPVGDYEMLVVIDAYNPETQEKAVVSAQAPITVHVVESK